MLSKPTCGWTTFSLGGLTAPGSYLEDYPFTLGYAFLAAAGKLDALEAARADGEWWTGRGVLIDGEGSCVTLRFSDSPRGYVVARLWSGQADAESGDEVLLEMVLDDERMQALSRELADDIEGSLDEWTREWSLDAEPYSEDVYDSRRRDLLDIVRRLRS